jgi:LPXTG-motif cell wall-anchored protein
VHYGNYAAFSGEWEDWSDAARRTWAAVTGDKQDAFELWKKSRIVPWGGSDETVGPGTVDNPNPDYRPNAKGAQIAGAVAGPHTAVGKAARGLPLHWSTDPAIVKAGWAGAAEALWKEGGEKLRQAGVIQPSQPATSGTGTPSATYIQPSQPATSGTGTPSATYIKPINTGGNIVVLDRLRPAMFKRELDGGGSNTPPATPEEEKSSTMMLVGLAALGIGAYFFLGKRRGGQVAMSGYSRRRRRRRSSRR